jgi:ribosomal protein L12E/L44/L45/RPP1/RPP2
MVTTCLYFVVREVGQIVQNTARIVHSSPRASAEEGRQQEQEKEKEKEKKKEKEKESALEESEDQDDAMHAAK